MLFKRFRLLRDESATSTPEYAIVLVVIIAAVVSMVSALGNASGKAFRLTALGQDQAEVASRPIQPDVATEAETISIQERIASIPDRYVTFAFVGGQAILAICMVYLLMLRKPKKKRTESIVIPEEVFAEQANSILLTLRHKSHHMATWEPLASHFMSPRFESVAENARRSEIEEKLNKSVHNAIVVIDKNKSAVGVIARSDLDESNEKARALMVDLSVSYDESTPMSTVLRAMLTHACTFATITKNEELVGVISHVEISTSLQAALQVMKETEAQHREMLLRTLSTDGQQHPAITTTAR